MQQSFEPMRVMTMTLLNLGRVKTWRHANTAFNIPR
jgi:hypothetical protein